MIKKMATSTASAISSIITWIIQGTFNPLAAGSIPARPTKIKDLQSPAKKATSTNVHTWAAVGVAFLLLPGTCFAGGWPAGWDFYFFGVNAKTFKEADWKMVALGAATSLAVHTAGHYLMAELNDVSIKQEGLKEIISSKNVYIVEHKQTGYVAQSRQIEIVYTGTSKDFREVAQAGFIAQHLVGLILTTIPATRQTDFTKGYVTHAFASTLIHPLLFNDLKFSDQNGGNRDFEYIGYMAVATHNLFRVKWEKE